MHAWEPLSVRGPAALPGNQLTICTERSLELPHSFSLVYFCTRVKYIYTIHILCRERQKTQRAYLEPPPKQ